jgi:hypothetical protein
LRRGGSALKKKSKLKTIIIAVSIFLVVVLGVGAVGFYVAGDYIFTTLLESYIEDEMTSSLEAALENEILAEAVVSSKSEGTDADGASPADSSQAGTPGAETTNKEAQEKTEQEAKPQPMTKEEVKQAVKEKAKVINESIPAKDKVQMSSLILDNLSSEDISYLAGLAADGLSDADLSAAKSIAKGSFTAEQIQQVKAFYNQYQGVVLENK